MCLLVVITFFLFGRTSPTDVVETTIEKIGFTSEHLPLAKTDIDKIASFFTFTEDHHLGKPYIKIKEASPLKDQAQVIATFEVIQYQPDNSIQNIYNGTLVFTLQKRSFFTWEIDHVDILQEMGEHATE